MAACVYWPPFSRTPGNVTAYVAGIEARLVERRIEQLDQRIVAPDEMRIERLHRSPGPLGVACAGQHGPALRDRIDPAFRIRSRSRAACRRRNRRADTTRRPSACVSMFSRSRCRHGIAFVGEASSPRMRASRETAAGPRRGRTPSQTLSPLPWMPTWFMPSFQSPEPINGRPCSPNRKPWRSGAHAMLVQGRGLAGPPGQVVVGLVVGVHRPAFEERHRFVEHARVAGREHVTASRERQPQVVVGKVRAHAAAGGRMPPVLDVAFDELPARRTAAGAARISRGSAWTSAMASCSWSRKPNAPPDW